MNSSLDVGSILYVAKATNLVGFVAMYYLYFSGGRSHGVRPLAFSFLSNALGLMLASYCVLNNDFDSVFGFFALFFGLSGHVLFAIGITSFSRSPLRLGEGNRYLYVALALAIAICAYSAYSDRVVHVTTMTLLGVLAYSLSSLAVFLSLAHEKSVIKIFLSAACAMYAVAHAVSAGAEWFVWLKDIDVGLVKFYTILLDFGLVVAFILLQNERTIAENWQLSNIDLLTGIANRRAFFEGVSRTETDSCAIIMLDIDHFKSINDTYGHAAGDFVLRKTAETIRSVVRASDQIARYGGEEFIVCMSNCTAEDANALAQRICNEVASMRLDFKGQQISLTISGGVCPPAQRGFPIDTIIRFADKALYRAKELGRNRIEICETDTIGASPQNSRSQASGHLITSGGVT